MHELDPSPAYLPWGQFVHDSTFERVEYLPATHLPQELAPALGPSLVMDPAAQLAQAVVEAAEYQPAEHALQVVAPALVSLLVTDPAEHVAQAVVEEAE